MRPRAPRLVRGILVAFALAAVLGMVMGGVEPGRADAGAPAAPLGTGPEVSPRVSAEPLLVLPPRPSTVPTGSVADQVNVYQYYGGEPAPFGIADYGVDNNGTVYSYGTDEIVGTAVIDSLGTYASDLGNEAYQGTLQLNIVLVFTSGSSTFAYWPQDVLFFDSSSDTMEFEDNIWNLSSGSHGMLTSTVSGNGSVSPYGGGAYYAAGAQNQEGNGYRLSYPATVQLRCEVDVSGGSPVVYFQFDDGYGWQTYDTAVFGFTRSVGSALFEVDGAGYAPNGLFEDAELVFGGPGDGSATAFTSSKVNLSLQFDNGHNLQEVPNAFDFGSDTAEAVSNGASSRVVVPTTGYLASQVTNGSGALGAVYDRGYSAILNGSVADPAGTYSIDGTSLGTFRNNELNLTLAPGSYTIELYVGSTLISSPTLVLQPGEYLAYEFTPPPVYPVNFTEEGLPVGTIWSASILHASVAGSNSTLNLREPNGTYEFEIGGVPGWVASAWMGFVTLNGSGASVRVTWTPYRVPVVATEAGLPPGTEWSFRLNGTLYAGNGSTISFELINGTYDYSPLGTSGYAPTYSQGQLTVSGSLGAASFLIGYVQVEYLVDFEVTGLPSSIAWILALDGTNYTIRADSFEVSLANGSYPFSAEAGGPYSLSLPVGPLVVEGAPRNVTLRFTPEPGRLLVSVSPGAAELSINGTVASGMNGSYSADLPPGTYLVNATESGYAPFTEIVTVGPGEVVPVSITLVPLHPSPMHTSPGPSHASTIPLGTLELVGGVIALLAAVLIAVLLATRRPRPPASG